MNSLSSSVTLDAGDNRQNGKENSTCSPRAEERTYLTGFKLALVLGSATLVLFLVMLDLSIVGVAIPKITSEYRALPDVGWYIAAYSLACASLQPFSGKLYTFFSTKVVFLAFTALFEVGSLICGAAPSSHALIAGRAIAGVGAAGIVNGGITIVSGAVPLEKNPMYTGVLLGLAQTGIVAGPLIGGGLTDHASWRWCFYINLPIGGAAALIFSFCQVPELTKKPAFSFGLIRKILPELDLIGFSLFAPAAVMLLTALQLGSGSTYNWDSSVVIGLICGAVATALVFIGWEHRMGDRAMIPGSILRGRVVWASCIFGTIIMCSGIIVSNWMPTFFQAVRGESPTLSGVHMLPFLLSQLVAVMISGAAVTRLGRYTPWALFGGIATVVGSVLVSTWNASTSTGQWVGHQVLLGIGRGASFQMAIVAIQNHVSPEQTSLSMAILVFFQNFGGSIAGVITNVIFTQTMLKAIPRYTTSIHPQSVLDAGSGAGAVRGLVPAAHAKDLEGILQAYSESLRNIFYFLTGISALATVVSIGMGWKDVRKQKKTEPEEGGSTEHEAKEVEEAQERGQ